MKRKFTQIQYLSLPVLALLMVLLAACSPATPVPVAPPIASPAVYTQVPSQIPQVLATENPAPATDQPALAMVATSRGPNLESTDPSTVNLASGKLHLVEFFRFT